jgi:CRP-like cAMP-binding protein
MLSPKSFPASATRHTAAAGELLLTRGQRGDWVTHVQSGRVGLGLVDQGRLEHPLGALEGPFWLEATAAVLDKPSVVDAVAETAVEMVRVPLPVFREWFEALPRAAREVMHDVALAHRQQTELAVSRLAKDAEARCAEWLLRNAEPVEPGSMAVLLRQHKRLIAAHLGIAPETLSRVLRHLREQSLISGTGRVLKLLDVGGLRTLAGV